jgi:hypothetical protein
MIDRELERIAFNNKEWNTVLYILDSYASDYLEGEIESSKDKFNSLFNKLPLDVVSKYKESTVFDCVKKLCDRKSSVTV